MKRIPYAWLICFATTLTYFCITGLSYNTFSIYMPFLLDQYGITNTQSSSLLLVRSLAGFLGAAVSGWYYHIFSMRIGMMISGLCASLGFVIYGLFPGYPGLLAGSFFTGIAFGIGATLSCAMLLHRWFLKKQNIAMSISTMGSTFALIGIPTLLTKSIHRFGIRSTFLMEAVLITVLILLCFLIIRSDPKELGLKPYGADASAEESADAKNETPNNGSSRRVIPSDWLMLTPMMILIGAVANPGCNHVSVFLNGEGISPERIAVAISAAAIFASVGKFMFGWLSELFGTYRCNYIYGGLMVAGLLTLCLTRSAFGLFAGLPAFESGVSLAMMGPLAWATDWSAPDQCDAVIQRLQKMYTLGSLLFSLLPGQIADRCGGSYLPAYWLFAAFAVFSVFAMQRQYIIERKRAV